METITQSPKAITPLADINGLRHSGIFPQGREPSIRTLREWTKQRRIPRARTCEGILEKPHIDPASRRVCLFFRGTIP
ncbi:MAG: hypothetical protein LBV12_11800 [Puniceicoccales bacterium]|nr:hypothetical protein [Puniceicoccales bacterium]